MYVATSHTYLTNRFVGWSEDLDAIKRQCLEHCQWISGHPAVMVPCVVITEVGSEENVRTLGGIYHQEGDDWRLSSIQWEPTWTELAG